MNTRKRIIAFLMVCIGILTGIVVVCSNTYVGIGGDIKNIEQHIEFVKEENIDISQKIASATSLLVIEHKSKDASYKNPTDIISIGFERFVVALGKLQ